MAVQTATLGAYPVFLAPASALQLPASCRGEEQLRTVRILGDQLWKLFELNGASTKNRTI